MKNIIILPTKEEIDSKIEEYTFRVPYDGSNNFYDEVSLKHFKAGIEWYKEQINLKNSNRIMNLDNIKTKGIVDENRFNDLSESISNAILNMRYLSKPDVSRLIKTQMTIFYEKQHEAKLRLKLRQTEDNMAEMRVKTKEHNVKMAFQTNFWKYKYKNNVTIDVFNEAIEEIEALEKNKRKTIE